MQIEEKAIEALEESDSEERKGITEDIVVRFRNANRPQKATSVKEITDMKQHCVGDYACCGRVP